MGKSGVVFLPLALSSLWACQGSLEVEMDLDPPRLVGTSLPDGAEVGTTEPILLRFSEPMDPRTVTSGSIVVVPHEEMESCSMDFACGPHRCHRGRCQKDPITDAWLSDLANPPLTDARAGQVMPATVELDRAGTGAILEFLRPMAPHRLHTLLVSAGISDRAGNALTLPGDGPLALRRIFATADANSGRPTLRLRSPPAGAVDVPINLARVVVQLSEPVGGVTGQTIGLRSAAGKAIRTAVVGGSTRCRGHRPGTCYELRLAEPLPPLTVIRVLVDEGVRDAQGQSILLGTDQAFASGTEADHTPPGGETLRVWISDGCAVVRGESAEPADLELMGSWGGAAEGSVGLRSHEVYVGLPDSGAHELRMVLQDLAGNQAPVRLIHLELEPMDRLAITEVLANPAGPEPAQEFIELFNLSSASVNLDGWILDDNDDGLGANILPGAFLDPGQFAVVVGKGYNPSSFDDPVLAAGALLIRLEGTLGASGLSNASEPVVLRDPAGRTVSTYGGHHDVSGKAFNGRSIERLQAGACDIRSSWRPDPAGRSSPGR